EIELGAPLDRAADLGSARGLRDRRESGEGLPAVQRPSGGAEAVPSAIFLLVVDEPVDGGPQAGILQVSESSEHPHRVPGEAQLTPGASEITRRPREPAEEERHRLRDARVFPRDPEIRQDQESPVRRDVLRSVQFGGGGARGRPLPGRVLFAEDLRGPSLPPDLLLRSDDVVVIFRAVQQVPEDPDPDARVGLPIEQPFPQTAPKDHGGLGIAGAYIGSDGRSRSCDRHLSAKPIRRGPPEGNSRSHGWRRRKRVAAGEGKRAVPPPVVPGRARGNLLGRLARGDRRAGHNDVSRNPPPPSMTPIWPCPAFDPDRPSWCCTRGGGSIRSFAVFATVSPGRGSSYLPRTSTMVTSLRRSQTQNRGCPA